MGEIDRDVFGREVRRVWIAWAREQPNPKPSWVVPYDELSEPDKEVDRRIGELLFLQGSAALHTERDALRATMAGLRESLEVFVPQHFRDRGGDDMTGYYLEGKVVRLGDIRRAFAALAAAPPATPAPDGRDTNDG